MDYYRERNYSTTVKDFAAVPANIEVTRGQVPNNPYELTVRPGPGTLSPRTPLFTTSMGDDEHNAALSLLGSKEVSLESWHQATPAFWRPLSWPVPVIEFHLLRRRKPYYRHELVQSP